jgi:tetratricopeptide (TPR) repeat protein
LGIQNSEVHASAKHVLFLGGSRAARLRAASASEHSGSFRPSSRLVLDPASLPCIRPSRAILPVAEPRLIQIDDLESAFAFDRTSSLRLIVSQSTYLLQKWIDVLSENDRIVAAADRDELMHNAPEAFTRRGPWRFFEIVELSTAEDTEDAEAFTPPAFQRLDSSASSVSSAVESLKLASTCRDRNDVQGARRALEEAAEFAPDWEAVHYETGKFWLACDDMERARDAFQHAADLMPTFSAAFSNLGATLGELDQPEAAIAAFSQALLHDPESFTILNNIGVVNREIGRLDESERALMRVTAIAPAFVFGHYNLGHTRFLRGDYAGALRAYEEGQRRDPERNRRQGCRLALVRFASGDLDGAERDLWRFADQAPQDEREDLLLEAYEIAQALVRAHPALASLQQFIDRIAAELTR